MFQTDAFTLARHIRTKQISAVEVVDAVLQRIDALQPTVNAFHRDRRRGPGRLRQGSPVHKGVRTTMGSFIFADQVPGEDAVPVRGLREAGAILVGKTTTPEFGHKPLTDTPLFGDTRNPWFPESATGSSIRTCGGASSGTKRRRGRDRGRGRVGLRAHVPGVLPGGTGCAIVTSSVSWLGRRDRAPQEPAFAQERFPFQWTRLIRHSRHPES